MNRITRLTLVSILVAVTSAGPVTNFKFPVNITDGMSNIFPITLPNDTVVSLPIQLPPINNPISLPIDIIPFCQSADDCSDNQCCSSLLGIATCVDYGTEGMSCTDTLTSGVCKGPCPCMPGYTCDPNLGTCTSTGDGANCQEGLLSNVSGLLAYLQQLLGL